MTTSLRQIFLRLREYVGQPQLARHDLDIQLDLLDTRQSTGYLRETLLRTDPQRRALIVSMSNVPFIIKAHALLAKGLQLRGYTPMILTRSSSRLTTKYLSFFGLPEPIYWDIFKQNHTLDVSRVESTIGTFLAGGPNAQDFKRLEFQGVRIGNLAISTMIRASQRGQFDLSSPEQLKQIRSYLIKAGCDVLAAEWLFRDYPAQKVIARDAGYTPNGAIFETALRSGVDAFRFEHALMMGKWMVKRYTQADRGQALFSISPESWRELKGKALTQVQQTALNDNFRQRYDPNSVVDLYQYQKGKQYSSPKEVRSQLGLDTTKKTAVVFAHISWDANFFDGEDLYDDFEHWLVETVKIACENSHINWVIKLHPANVHKLQREGAELTEETELKALRSLGLLPAHVKIMRANNTTNSWSLFPLVDYALTVRGTIGMELPCFGIPVVTAGTGRYSGYGFTIDPQSREEYRTCLLKLHQVPPLTEQQIDLARCHAYHVFLCRLASFEEISRMTTRVSANPTHPLHHNLKVAAASLKEIGAASHFQAFLDWVESGGSDFRLVH